MNNRIITFILPGSVRNVPIGGVKVVYEYANRFASVGLGVNVVYVTEFPLRSNGFISLFYSIIKWMIKEIIGYSGKKWFCLDNSVKELCIPKCTKFLMPDSDYYVATSVSSSIKLNALGYKNKKLFYLIQGYETWEASEETIRDTFRYEMQKIVISKDLKNIVEACGTTATYIPNGFDYSRFRYDMPCENRNKYSISMLYHLKENKGCNYGLESIKIVKSHFPSLVVRIFGTPPRPNWLPLEYEYYCQPDKETHNRINNESGIFISPSLTEGWGLTVGEAMICGQAVVCTDIGGHREIAQDGVNALLCPIKNSEAMANCIMRLIEDDALRIKLSKNAEESIHGFSWDKSFELFKDLVIGKS